jgi:surface protein
MKSSINKLNNGYIGLNYLNQYDSGRMTPAKYYNDVMDSYELGDEYQNTYTPPPQWAQLPSITGGEQRFAGVVAIYNDVNFLALNVTTTTGNYLVDWGDGTTGSFASTVQAQKRYEPSVYASLTSDIFRNYKTLVVTVRPITGNFQRFFLNSNFTGVTNLPTTRAKNWLNVRIAGSSIIEMNWGECKKLEQIDYVGRNSLSGMYAHFSNLPSLKRIVQYYTGGANRFDLCFNGTGSLTTIPAFDLSGLAGSAFGTVQMFYGAKGLVYVPWMDTSKVTSMQQMFWGCNALRSIPPFDTSNVTNMQGMFINCHKLKSIPKLNTSKVTNFSGAFQYCYNLKTIPTLDYSSTTTVNRMFYDTNLIEFPDADFPVCTDFLEMFFRHETLYRVGKLNCPAGITFNSMFVSCPLLPSVEINNTQNGVDFASMFQDCSNLRTVKGLSLANGRNFSSMFRGTIIDSLDGVTLPSVISTNLSTTGLQSMFQGSSLLSVIPTVDVSGLSAAGYASVYSNMFASCTNLISVGLTGIQHNFSVASAMLGPTALNNLYTSLAVVGASGSATKTITVTSNWGASTTQHNPAIAVAKGWAVTN